MILDAEALKRLSDIANRLTDEIRGPINVLLVEVPRTIAAVMVFPHCLREVEEEMLAGDGQKDGSTRAKEAAERAVSYAEELLEAIHPGGEVDMSQIDAEFEEYGNPEDEREVN